MAPWATAFATTSTVFGMAGWRDAGMAGCRQKQRGEGRVFYNSRGHVTSNFEASEILKSECLWATR
jgi:type 1 glutamine amidotransferase